MFAKIFRGVLLLLAISAFIAFAFKAAFAAYVLISPPSQMISDGPDPLLLSCDKAPILIYLLKGCVIPFCLFAGLTVLFLKLNGSKSP